MRFKDDVANGKDESLVATGRTRETVSESTALWQAEWRKNTDETIELVNIAESHPTDKISHRKNVSLFYATV